MIRPTLFACIAFAGAGAVNLARAETITMYLDPYGTTSNMNVFGTVLTNGTATWPARNSPAFRDYQFELKTTTGTTTFDSFAVQLSASLRNQTSSENLLRATLWSGPMVPNPLLANSLVTVSTPNSGIANASSGFSSSVILSGSSFGPLTITTSPSTFFFRVWAQGATSNEGYQTKMANSLEFQSNVTMAPSAAIDSFVEYDINFDGTIDSGEAIFDPVAEVVPEPSTFVLLASGVGLASLAAIRRRRRSASPVVAPRA